MRCSFALILLSTIAACAGSAAPPAGDVDWALVMRNAPKLPEGTCEPEDIAGLFAYLASDEARKITGSLFTIDGVQLAG